MRRAAAALALLAALASACGDGGGEGDAARLRVVVPDNNVRAEGVECAGARPFQQIHRGTPYRLEDGRGELVAEGELPAGTAENAQPSIEWETDRFPTVCVFDLELELPERDRYTLVLPGTAPLGFDGALLARAEPLLLVLRG